MRRLNVEVLEDRVTPSFTWAGDLPLGDGGLGGVTWASTGRATADFNRDGYPDTVSVNNTNSLILQLSKSDGTFSDPRTVANGVIHVAADDFTGDGIPDLLVSGWYGLAVLPGHGEGTFAAPIPSAALGASGWLAVADFNGDGQLDVFTATGSLDSGAYGSVCLGRGDGTFVVQRQTIGVASDNFAIAIGDFNGDRRPDLAWQYQTDLGEYVASEYLNAGDWGWGPYLFFSDATVSGGNTGTADATFTLSLAHASNVDLTFDYATADGSATAGSDYQAASGTLTLPAGQTAGTITVLVNGDSLPEPNETFSVSLSREHWAGVTLGYGTGTIVDGESHISIGDVTVKEGNAGAAAASLTVTLSAASAQAVTVAYATANGSAAAGSDYQAKAGTLTFAPGQTSKTITVLVSGDRLPEANETFFVNLSSPTNATIADGQGAGTILDDEPRISIGDVTRAEGKKNQATLYTFTVTLSAGYDQAVTMAYRTADGTATTGDGDYTAKTGTLTFAPGETTKTITIEVKGDSKREATEYFYMDLFGNSGNSLFTKSRGTGTILNDD